MKNCTAECYECIICRGSKVCCSCDWNNGYHACVKWMRGKNEAKSNKTKRHSMAIDGGVDIKKGES